MEYLIGIDLGGTNIVCGLLDLAGNVLCQSKQSTDSSKGCDDVIRRIAGMVEAILQERNLTRKSIVAVGMGTPGRVNPETGMSISSANLGWKNVPVAKLLQGYLQRPVFIDNDVRMYVYGEALKGAGRNHRHVLGVTVGTGFASAFVTDGQLHYGGDFAAGEMGHISMDGLDQRCNCGKDGCLETVVSASGIARQARQAINEGKQSMMQEWHAADLTKLTAQDVSKAYDLGDAVAMAVMERTGNYLAKALAFAVSVVAPDIVIIGGGGALAGERLLLPMKAELRRLVPRVYWDRMEITTAQWNEEAGMIGSALFAKQKAEGVCVRCLPLDQEEGI